MRKSLLISIFGIVCTAAMPGCQSLLNLFSGSGANDTLLPGGNVTVELQNKSGFPITVDATYTSSDTQVRHTTRILTASGPASDDTILSTRTVFLDIDTRIH